MALASRVTLKSLTSLSLFMVLSLMFPLCVSSRVAAVHLGGGITVCAILMTSYRPVPMSRTIRKETKRTEELEEAGYRSTTWAVLRALQQINSTTRIEGEAAMSAPPFFQSAGRGDLLFWGKKEGPTVVIWESLSEQEKKSWLEEANTMHDWVVWCKSQKEGTSRAERTIQVMVEARQYQNGSERGSRFMLGSQRSHCHNKKKSGFVDSSEGVGRKRRMSSTTDRYRAGILDGHRDRQIGRLRFPRRSHSR